MVREVLEIVKEVLVSLRDYWVLRRLSELYSTGVL